MPSEYDFLSPYSRRARRFSITAIGLGAFAIGAASMAAIVALPMLPLGRDGAPATTATTPTIPATESAAAKVSAAPSPSEADTKPASTKVAMPAATVDHGNRETTGASAPPPGGETSPPKPAPAAASAATAAAPPAPPAKPSPPPAAAPDASSHASTGETTSPSLAAPERNAETAKPKKSASQSRRAREVRSARTRSRGETSRSARAPWDEQRSGREYIAGNGVRYYIVRRSTSAYAYDDMPRRRIMIVRPGPFYDD
jgi:hypothetical protein